MSIPRRTFSPDQICSLIRFFSYLHRGEELKLERLRSLYFEPLKRVESPSLHLERLPNFSDSSIFLPGINDNKRTKIDAAAVRSLGIFAIGTALLYSSLCSISKLSSFDSSFHQRAEIMVVGRERSRFGRKRSRCKSKLLKALLRMKKWVTELKAKLNRTRMSMKKLKANMKEKEIRYHELRKSIEFRTQGNAFGECLIDLTLDIMDKEEEGDFVSVNHPNHSRSELVAKHMEETRDFMDGGGPN